MPVQIPEHAIRFRERFAHVENLLRRAGYVQQKRRSRALVDWVKFAREFNADFFLYVQGSQQANTLLSEPPRVLDAHITWQPLNQTPIADVVELFQRGVCQVRNNIVHGEKYIDSHDRRDDELVSQAAWVLEQAIDRHPNAATIFARLRGKPAASHA